ncbi:MAG: apolipoprotein N-acyltransferase, partial [Spirochaetales bacterium]|nr:apolipoprotein N-acyltransferase [Spirochaetales bacterium]MCF7937038.1 apolipoprotein N-acyltransferase [Spirochaetales bacterium]
GESFLTVLPCTFLGHALISGFRGFADFGRRHRIDGMIYAGVIVFVVIFGLVVKADFSETPRLRAAMIQQNVDPWKGGIEAYERNLEILIRQSDRALEEDPEIVIWSETSFVPGIDWHRRYRTNRRSYQLVKRLTDYLDTKDVPFVIGNDDGRLEVDELTGERGRVDYNATILYDEGEIQEIYRKVHLVPFTEYFPYRGILTGIYHWLKNADTHFWKEGDEYTVFEAAGVQFSTPICFEDTFGYISRNFVRNGADLIVNMTNDSWSFSVAAEMQHMAMSVMRAVENRRSVVRSTNGGITCTIDANGKIRTTLEPFIEGYLVDEVPVYTEDDTIYTRWGEWFGLLMLFGGLGLLVLGAVLRLTKRNN